MVYNTDSIHTLRTGRPVAEWLRHRNPVQIVSRSDPRVSTGEVQFIDSEGLRCALYGV